MLHGGGTPTGRFRWRSCFPSVKDLGEELHPRVEDLGGRRDLYLSPAVVLALLVPAQQRVVVVAPAVVEDTGAGATVAMPPEVPRVVVLDTGTVVVEAPGKLAEQGGLVVLAVAVSLRFGTKTCVLLCIRLPG